MPPWGLHGDQKGLLDGLSPAGDDGVTSAVIEINVDAKTWSEISSSHSLLADSNATVDVERVTGDVVARGVESEEARQASNL
jgi:hypothetical protein